MKLSVKQHVKPFLLIFSALFSLMLLMSHKVLINNNESFNFREGAILYQGVEAVNVADFCVSDIFVFLVYLAITYIVVLAINNLIGRVPIIDSTFPKTNLKKYYLLFTITLLLMWLPCLLTYYPGAVFIDTRDSISMARREMALGNRHPILYTLSWKCVLALGDALGLNYAKEFFAYTMLQSIFLACVCAYFLCVLIKYSYSKKIIVFSFFFFGMFNLIPLFLVSLWKDTPFGISVMLYSVFLFDIIQAKDWRKVFWEPKRLVGFVLISILVAFGRNNGFIACIVFSLIFYVFYAIRADLRHKIEAGIYFAAFIVAFCIIRYPLFNGLGLNEKDIVESSGVPIQQIAYIIANDGEISLEDKEEIEKIMTYENIKEQYSPLVVDSLKWSEQFNKQYLDDNYDNFKNIYLRTVIKNPSLALKGFMLTNLSFWSIYRQTADGYINIKMWPRSEYSMHDLIDEKLGIGSLQLYYKPLVYISSAGFAWFLLFSTCFALENSKKRIVIAHLPALILWGTILIATPIAFSLRYVFFMVLLVPLNIAIIFKTKSIA